MEMLRSVREETHAKNFDEVIRMLILQLKKPKTSMRGMAKHTREFVRDEIDRFA